MPRERRTFTGGFDLELHPRGDDATVEPAIERRPAPGRRQRRTIEAVSRPLPTIDEMQPTRRQRRRVEREDRDYTNYASSFRNAWVAVWTQLWVVGRVCVPLAATAYFAVGAWLGQPWAWIAAALPLVVLVLWLRSVLAQGRRHVRGQAGPPPGWIGRF
jgi:hypothetical protein